MFSTAPKVGAKGQMAGSDSAPRNGEPPETSRGRQPWRLFWPPARDSDVFERLMRTYPEVLSWQFDVARPFDRPWRQWTDSERVKEGLCPPGAFVNPESHGLPDRDEDPRLDVADLRAVRFALDGQLEPLKLPTVRPESFNYLAPLDLYEREKPYKCQLPATCFGESKMSNLASRNYPGVVIANVAGHESLFSLERSGFEFVKCPIEVREWSDETVLSEYLPSLAEWLKERLGCQAVFCYAYNVRLFR